MAVGPPRESDAIASDKQAGEDAKKQRRKSKLTHYTCQVKCLDGSVIKAEVEKTAKGEVLYNKVIEDLRIIEKEYVGLNFRNDKGINIWLDIHKEMKHQIGEHSDIEFDLRLKFYEPEPTRIKDSFLKYLFYLQIRDDLTVGRLKCEDETYAILGSFTAQAELRDYNPNMHDHNYLSDYEFAPAELQSPELYKRVHELHKERRGLSQALSEKKFLEVAKKIPRYGVEIHKGKDMEGEVEIGVAAIGIYVYRFSEKLYLFRWQVVDTIQYNRRKYTIKTKEGVPKAGEESAIEDDLKQKKKPQLRFIYYFDSATKCKQCYKASVEYHTFFRLAKPDSPRKKADSLKLGSSFRYSDRTLYQLRQDPDRDNPATDVEFTRTPSCRRTNTPRESWNPEDEHLKDNDIGVLKNGHHLPLVDEELQYEEIEIDEANPDDEKFDPDEWEVVEKELPDGTKKRYRRRVINIVVLKKKKLDEPTKTTPLMNEQYYADEDTPIQTYPDPVTPTTEVPKEEIPTIELPAISVDSEPESEDMPKMILEEVEIDETNPEDSWYDPSEWDVVERTMPNGTKKRYRVRLVKADEPSDADVDAVEEQEVMEMEEVEIDENDPEDSKYDPKEWDVVERREPDGTKKRFRRRYLIKTVTPVPKKPLNSLVDEPVMQLKEVDMDEEHPEIFDADEWQVVDKLTPDGKTKKVRRTILITRINVIPKKPSEVNEEEPLGVLEEVNLEETPDISHLEDADFDPEEWELAEKTLPDGKTQIVRRRVLINKVKYVYKKPCDVASDEPMALIEEVEVDPRDLQQQFDPKEWEFSEKELLDGTIKPVCRRALVNNVEFVNKKPSEVPPSSDSFIAVEEIDVGDESPEDSKYDPTEWEVVEKTLPNGELCPVHRRIVITRNRVIIKKPSEVDPNEPLAELEEVEIGEDPAEGEQYNPSKWELAEIVQPDGPSKKVLVRKPSKVHLNEPLTEDSAEGEQWEFAETVQPDGSTKKVCRRFIITRVEYIHKKPSDVTADEQPVAELEEIEVDEENPDDDKYDPNEWEITDKTTPEGEQSRVRQRYIIRRVHISYKKPSDVTPDLYPSRVEEVEIDEKNPQDELYDPDQWDIVEKTSPGCLGQVKRVRRRIVVTDPTILHKVPSEISDEDPLKEVIKNDAVVNPEDWEDVNFMLADGEEKPGRRRYIVPEVTTEFKKPSEVPTSHPLVEIEEFDISPMHVEDQMFDPDEWEMTEKTLPDGTRKPVVRRYKIKNYIKEYKKPCDVEPEIPIAVIEEAEIEPTHIEDDQMELDGWEAFEKDLPDGTTKKVKRRYMITHMERICKKPDEVSADTPHVEVEEMLINEDEEDDDDKYDPHEWDVVEKVTPSGEHKRFRCRIKVIKVAKVHFRPSDITLDDKYKDEDIQVEELGMEEQLPEDFDPEEWDIVEKLLPDGTMKPIRRRLVVTRVEILFKKPSEVTDSEPLGIAVEELPIDEAEEPGVDYDPSEWEVVEKPCPDGTKQKVRRRIVVTYIRAHKKLSVPHEPPPAYAERPIPIVEEELVCSVTPDVEHFDDSFLLLSPEHLTPEKRGSKKILRRRSIKTTITPVGGRSVSVSTEEVPKQTEEVEIDESDPQDEKYDSKEWETIEKILPDGTVKRFRRRIVETLITTVNKKHGDVTTDGGVPVRMEEFEIDDAHPENDQLDPSECEILEKKLPDGSLKRYSRRIVASSLPDTVKENEPPALWEEVEIDELNPDDNNFDTEEWEEFEKTYPDGSKKRFRRRNLNVITVHKKPIAITAGDAPLRVQEIEVDEDVEEELNLDDWEVVEKTLPDGRKKKFHRKILTTIFSSLNEKNEMIENPPIHIEEEEIYEASSDEEDVFSPKEWEVVEKVLPDGRVIKVRTRSSVTVITPKDTMKLEDKSVEETPVVAEEIELDESTPHEHLDPEEWDIIEKKLPDGTTKRFHRRIIRKYKKVPSRENLLDEPVAVVHPDEHELEEIPVEEIELHDHELEKYDNTPDWEIVEKTMPDGSVKRFRRKVITTVVTTVTTKTIVVHPDGREEVVDIETTPGDETIHEIDSTSGDIEIMTQDIIKKLNLQPEDEVIVQPMSEDVLETGVDMTFDVDNILSEIDQFSKSLNHDDTREPVHKEKVRHPQKHHDDETKGTGEDITAASYVSGLSEEELRRLKEEEKQRLDAHNATISSIFSIDDDEYKSPTRPTRDHGCTECDGPVAEETFTFASADVEYAECDDADKVVRTASVLKQKNLPNLDRHPSEDEDRKKRHSLDRRYLKRGDSEPNRPQSATSPQAGSPEKSRTISQAGIEQGDVYRPHGDVNAEILYTLKDVSEVEQGEGGFVQAIKQKHDKMATDEAIEVQHESEYPEFCVLPPRGHVPTHTVNYNDVREPDVTLTKDPPSVTGVPTVIYPARSELPDEEVVFEISKSPVESHPDLLSEISDVVIPEVRTQSVVFEEKMDDEVLVRDPGVETRTVQIVPVTESYTMQDNLIHDFAPTEAITDGNRCQVTTYTMPTEVITKTITIEDDSSTLSREELQDIIRRTGSNENILDEPNLSSAHVVSTTTVQKVITGKTITVVGDDEEELQKAINEAVKNATDESEEVDDGTIVLTAIHQYDEDGNIINTEVVERTETLDNHLIHDEVES